MKIGYIKVTPTVPVSSGIKVQAQTWGDALIRRGHIVDYINMWEPVDWKSYDIIHIFDYSPYMVDLIREIRKMDLNIVNSPIIDANYKYWQFKFASHLAIPKLRLYSRFNSLRSVSSDIKMFYVRSEYEKGFMIKSYGIPEERVSLVPLSYRIAPPEIKYSKENFCLHVSLLADKRKNVERIIQASNKYKFELRLGGKLRDESEKQWLDNLIVDSKYVKYLGFLTDEQLSEQYQKARVFALPSTYEGVGMVALEAAVMGDDIVITNLGGPKEYYGHLAKVVDPYNVDEIGLAIKSFLDGETFQPMLSDRIVSKYNLEATIDILEKSYYQIIKNEHS